MNKFPCSLNDAYRRLLSGASFNISAHELASTMASFVCEPYNQWCEQIPVQGRYPQLLDTPRHPLASPTEDKTEEMTCIALTLMEKMGSKLISQSLSQEDSLYFSNVYRILLQDFGLMSKLIHHFQAKDRLTSHLAAKSVSAYVFLEIQSSEHCNAVNPIWEGKCLQVFQNPCPSNELDACLWSLTAVIKTMLKGSHGCTESLEKLLAAFDPALSALCSKLLPGECVDHTECAIYSNNTGDWGTTLCTLLDLLEVLTAARLRSWFSECFQSQRLSHTRASGLLRIVNTQLDYFVKKRVLLLLKRTLLQKAGEDMALGEGSANASTDTHMCSDLNALADDVLQAVRADWLQCVPLDSAAVFFGGSSRSCDGGSGGPDYVMLRAVSLVLLKSLEYKIQSGGTTGVDGAVEVPVYMRALLSFLSQRGVQLPPGRHPCTWVSLVFGEQDDDIMEAAKTLLLLQLHHGAPPGTGQPAADSSATSCAVGCNPHCHFLSLLQSVSFDHSILLDFLISTETCFLEYFVRYLKHLLADWEGFSTACLTMEALDCRPRPDSWRAEPLQLSPVPCSGVSAPGSGGGPGASAGLVQPSRASPLRLVEYGSSDESEPEEMDVSGRGAAELETCSLEARSGRRGLDLLQGTENGQTASVGDTQRGHQAPGSSQRLQTTSDYGRSWPRMNTSSRQSLGSQSPGRRLGDSGHTQDRRHGDRLSPPDDMNSRTVTCLSELRVVLARLQSRNLFPYNPTSLLKLLTHIETKSGSQRLKVV